MQIARLKPVHWAAIVIGLALVVLAVWWLRLPAPAGTEGEVAAPVADTQGRVRLSADQRESLGIKTVEAQAATTIPIIGLPAEAMPPLAASSQVTIPFSGVVTRVLVDEGERVVRGQPLLRLHSRELIGIQGDLARARSEAGLAAQQARRDATLADEGIIPTARRAESAVRASAAKVTLDEANAMLSQLRRAPDGLPGEFDLLAGQPGLVLRRNVTPGKAVEAMSAAFVIADTDALDVRFSIPIALRAKLRAGLAIELPGGAQGVVVAVGADTDSATQTLRVRARAESPDDLVAGQQFEIALQLPAPPDAVVVPVSALQPHGQREALFVQDGASFRGLVVERLGGDADSAVVRGAGLRAGMLVVSKGGSVLKSLAPVIE